MILQCMVPYTSILTDLKSGFWGVIIQGDEFRYFLIGIAIDKHWQVILTRSKATIARKI